MIEMTLLSAITAEHLQSAARYLSRPASSREMLIFVLFAIVIGAIWTVLFLWDRTRRQVEPVAGPTASLFEELTAALRLSPQETATLMEAAQESQLDSPLPLFVQPERFEPLCAETHPKAGMYRSLRDKLFGKLAA